jgi:hypothetical protein
MCTSSTVFTSSSTTRLATSSRLFPGSGDVDALLAKLLAFSRPVAGEAGDGGGVFGAEQSLMST